jgi:hypothetical protein
VWNVPWTLASAPALAADAADAWRGARWVMELEETTASPVTLAAEENRSFRTRALQLSAVVTCPEATVAGRKVTVRCTFESLALRATPRSDEAARNLVTTNDAVLADVARRLTSGAVELVVSDRGKVTAVDLPDLKGTTRWESESRETLRRLAWDLAAGWSLDRPDTWKSGWVEKNTPLLRPPLEPGAMGLSRTEHGFAVVEGLQVVSSQGRGTFTAPYVPWESSYEGKSIHGAGQAGGVTRDANNAITGVTADRSGTSTEQRPDALSSLPTDLTLEGELRSVAVFDAEGRLTERIYTMAARPTASSVGNMQGWSVTSNAHLRRLAPGEQVDVGVTGVVAPRGTTLEGLPAWVPVSTF